MTFCPGLLNKDTRGPESQPTLPVVRSLCTAAGFMATEIIQKHETSSCNAQIDDFLLPPLPGISCRAAERGLLTEIRKTQPQQGGPYTEGLGLGPVNSPVANSVELLIWARLPRACHFGCSNEASKSAQVKYC